MAPQLPDSENTVKTLKPSSGRQEIYYDGYFYDVTEWIPRHPGGGVIKFFTQKGEDATIPIQQFHKRSWKKILGILKSLRRRPAEPNERKYELQVETA